MSDKDWIKDLKAGDKVYVHSSNYMDLQTVKTITPKGFIRTSGGGLYDLYGFQKSHDAWSRSNLVQWTPEIEIELRKNSYRLHTLKRMREVKMITYEQAYLINEILDSNEVKHDN